MSERSYGLDICRITAMVMITALHINYQHLGLLRGGLPYWLSAAGFFIEYACFAGVNCFAMLSGYLLGEVDGGYDRKWGYRCLSLWLKIVFWGIILSGIGCLHQQQGISLEELWQILFPVSGCWWYISAYFGVLLFMPLINRGLNRLPTGDLLIMSGVMFLLFSVLPLALENESALGLGAGYTVVWLMICYIFGAALKRIMPQLSEIKNLNLITVILLIFSVLLPLIPFFTGGNRFRMMSYLSPLCVIEALCLVILCVQIKIKNAVAAKVISFVSTNSLGIYLLQMHPLVWDNFIFRKDPPFYPAAEIAWRMPLMILLLVAGGVLANFIIEALFRIFGLSRLCRKICRIEK